MSARSGLESDDLQSYFDTLNKVIRDVNSETASVICDSDSNITNDVDNITTLHSVNDVNINNDVKDNDDVDIEVADGTIIMDVDGNYYFQTSNSTVSVKPLPKAKATKTVLARSLTVKAAKKLNTEKKTVGQANLRNGRTRRTRNQKTPTASINESKSNTIQCMSIDTIKKEDAKSNALLAEDDRKPSDNGVITVATNPETTEQQTIEVKPKAEFTVNKNDANTTTLNCSLCKYSTSKKILFSRHCKTHSNERPYKCSVCEKGFKTNASLLNHVNMHLGNKPHHCTDCEKRFTTSGELVRHVRYCHTGFKPHKCTECDYSSVEMSKLKRHMRCHTGERPYQCPHCTYASPDTFKLKRHLRTHTGEKPYECDICHARFTQSNSLKHHKLIHLVNEKPVFQCNFCPTTCGRKTDLRLHIQKLHTTDKAWPCNRCGKDLPDRYSYKVHVKTHDGEKCYRCKYCPYASTTQRHLHSHTLMHTDEKPYICSFCKKCFRQKQLLNRHVNLSHNDNYKPPEPRAKLHACPYCDRSFTFKGNLMRHMELHDDTHLTIRKYDELELGLEAFHRIEESADAGSKNEDDATNLQHDDDDKNFKQILNKINADEILFIYKEEVTEKKSPKSTTNSTNTSNASNTTEQTQMKSENASENTENAIKDENKKPSVPSDDEVKLMTGKTLDIKNESINDKLLNIQIEDGEQEIVLEVIEFDGDEDGDDDDDGDGDDDANNASNGDANASSMYVV